MMICFVAADALGAEDGPQVWLISTRCAPPSCPTEHAARQLRYWVLRGDNCWKPADRQAFLHGDTAQLPTTIFIHGNRTDTEAAIRKGWYLYQQIRQDSAGKPFRFVIWSWPSDRMLRRARQDAQLKADYSDAQGYYLAHLLKDANPQAPVSLVGYSFGARAVAGALGALAGGRVAGRSLGPAAPGKTPPLRVILIAAAMDAGSLSPGCAHGPALAQVEKMLVLRNCCDRALKWYPRLYGRGGAQAIGYAGPYCSGQQCAKIELIDVSCSVGRIHDWYLYGSAPGLRARLAWYTFLAADSNEGGRTGRQQLTGG